jgi:predicted PurR-regulated permease PerM
MYAVIYALLSRDLISGLLMTVFVTLLQQLIARCPSPTLKKKSIQLNPTYPEPLWTKGKLRRVNMGYSKMN